MKSLFTILLIVTSLSCFAQIDTTLDYKDRFHKDVKLINEKNSKSDLKNGYWIEYYDKHWNLCAKGKSKYYRLIEYTNGLSKGKVYDFYNSGKLQMVGEYERLDPEIKRGTFMYFSENAVIISLEHYSPNSQLVRSYYKNGNVKDERKEVKGRNFFNYSNSSDYFKNGNPKNITFYDTYLDSIYTLRGRENGTVVRQSIRSKGHSVSVKSNKKGRLLQKTTVIGDSSHIQYFKKTKLIHNEIQNTNNNLYLGKYRNINYYEGQIGGNQISVTIKSNDSTEYRVDEVKMTEEDYLIHRIKYEEILEKRKKIHYYHHFTKDSVLIYEGLFCEIDSHCGIYRTYYLNGMPKVSARFDKKGRESGVWIYYDNNGLQISTEYYRKGKKINANRT
jgi:hypothetical protein